MYICTCKLYKIIHTNVQPSHSQTCARALGCVYELFSVGDIMYLYQIIYEAKEIVRMCGFHSHPVSTLITLL